MKCNFCNIKEAENIFLRGRNGFCSRCSQVIKYDNKRRTEAGIKIPNDLSIKFERWTHVD